MNSRFRFALWPSGFLFAAGAGSLLGACAAVGAGAAAGVAAAQERGFTGAISDTEVRPGITRLWFQESTSLYSKADQQVQERRVLLTGDVRRVVNHVRLKSDPARQS